METLFAGPFPSVRVDITLKILLYLNYLVHLHHRLRYHQGLFLHETVPEIMKRCRIKRFLKSQSSREKEILEQLS